MSLGDVVPCSCLVVSIYMLYFTLQIQEMIQLWRYDWYFHLVWVRSSQQNESFISECFGISASFDAFKDSTYHVASKTWWSPVFVPWMTGFCSEKPVHRNHGRHTLFPGHGTTQNITKPSILCRWCSFFPNGRVQVPYFSVVSTVYPLFLLHPN